MPDPAAHRPFSLGSRPGPVTGVGGWALGRSGDAEFAAGPRGAFGYHGRIPGYTELVLAVGRVLRLAVGRIHRDGDTLAVERVSSPFGPRSWVGKS